MGLWDTTNLLKNGYFSTDTSITGDCSLRNDGKSILAGGLVVEDGITATSSQTIDFGANVPTSSGTPVNGNDLVNVTYGDANYHPIGSYMDLTTNQTVTTGVKTFNVAPVVPRLGMASTNSTFVGNNISLTTASEGTYVGYSAGRLQNNLASRNTALGCQALDRLPASNQNTGVGYQALFLFADGGSLANTALGAYSLATLRSGSRNIGVGTAAGNGLVNLCSNNVAFASDTLSNSSNKTLFNYANISGADIPNANPFIIDPIRFNISTGTIRARMYVRYFNAAENRGGTARIESYDSATYAITYITASGAPPACKAGSVLRFTQGGSDTSVDYNYTGAGGTGTTFTIGTGLAIVAGNIMVYSTTATKTQWATVSSYTSGTGVLVLTTSITLVAGLMNFFGSALDRGSYVNDCCAIGAGALQNFACGQTAPMTGNCAFGQMALNGAGGGYDNASFLAGSFNTAFGNKSGVWNTGDCANNTFLGANSDILVPYSVITNSTAIGYNAKLDLSNLIALGTSTETVRCWNMDVRGLPTLSAGLSVTAGTIDFSGNVPRCTGVPVNGSDLVNKTYVDSSFHPIGSYVDLTTNQTVGGVKSFTSNLRAIATTGDVFQAYKNSVVGNAGHVLVNGDGNLLYYDTTASLIKWRLDTDGKLTVGNIDLSGTMINKTTTAGDYIRSNSNATNYFYASNTGNIGFANSASNIGVNWYINADGNARFKSSTNSFKYWDINSNQFRYYNLGGINSILMNGDVGSITTTGAITTAGTTTTANLNVSGTINSAGAEATFGGDISTFGGVYGEVIAADFSMSSKMGLDITDPVGFITFSGLNAGIRVGVGSTTLTDTTANNINIGNNSIARGGENVVIGYLADGGSATGLGAIKGQGTVQVGAYCESMGEYSVGVGHNTTSYKEGVAIGRNAFAAPQGVSLGYGSSAGQDTNIAIGYNAKAPFQSSIAIGPSVETTFDGQVAIGSDTSRLFLNQNYFPYEVSPTAINASMTISPPFYAVYNITASTGITITISGLTPGTNGILMTFRKTVSTVAMSIISGAGFSYFPFNGVSAITTSTTFIGSGQTVGRIAILNATQFMVCT